MVVDEGTEQEVDRLFHAMADATRRDILQRCTGDGLSVTRLAAAYPMSFAAVHKHVDVLARAGLVRRQRRGREQLVHTEHDGLRQLRQALDDLERTWRARADRMSDLLAEPGHRTPNTDGGQRR
ncbi:ArsR/SmtB family transcription factor [Nakamurella endophytica]|uniref:Transcriptional regulator n=1 Tax=Nakamurella endophytica TaxID=1748367 RepID=A0A917T6T4_9ACTN|nr:metalloregulator ArsR/SmtB family transcription factor [Nakamurella endophytica]GGM11119.1 transcriptional regulator [Nakamurella endophytica]